MGLKRRIQKLDGGGHHFTPDNCPAPPQQVVRLREGEPPPSIPTDLPCCRLCGGTHVVEIVEVMVKDRAEAVHWLARMRSEEGGWAT